MCSLSCRTFIRAGQLGGPQGASNQLYVGLTCLPAEAEHWKDVEFLVLPLLSLGLGSLDGARHSGGRAIASHLQMC